MHKKIFLFLAIILFAYNVEARSCSSMSITNCNYRYDDMGNECYVNNGVCTIKKQNANTFTDMSCKIINIPSAMRTIAVRFSQTGDARTGYIYKMFTSDDDFSPAFCLDPGKSNGTTYRPVRQLTSSSEWDIRIAIAYNWFLNHPDKLEEAQLIMWYIAENMFNNTPYNSNNYYAGVGSVLRNYYIGGTDSCKTVEGLLQTKFNNKLFSCDCYYTSCGDTKKRSRVEHNSFTDKDEYKLISTEDFDSALSSFFGSGGTESAYTREMKIAAIVEQLKNTTAFGGGSDQHRFQLWLYEPDGGTAEYQRIIGLGFCKYMGYICEKKYPDYLAGEYGKDLTSSTTIANFKAALLDPENVIPQPDGTVKCGTGTDRPSCNSLLVNNGYTRYSTCDELKRDIYNPEKVSDCVEQNGKVSYLECGELKCDPKVDVKNAACHLKDASSRYFELSDASIDSGDPNYACILNNSTAYKIQSSKVSSKDENFSASKYCDVYCWESLYASLPTEPAPTSYVESGRLFFWGLNYYKKEFANFEVRRICWSKNINYEQFKTDWNNNESAIAKAKTAYDNQVSYNAKSGWDSTEACKYDCVSTSSTETVSCGNYNQHGNCGANDCYWDGSCWKRDKSSETCKDGTRYKRGAVGSGDTASTSYDKCLGSAPNESDIDNSSEEASRKSTLEGLIKKRQSLKNAIMACQSTQVINENTIYKHTASIELVDNQQLGLCNVRGVCGEKLKLNNIVEDQRIETNTPQTGSFNVSCTDVGAFNSNNPCAVDGGTTIPVYLNNGYEWDYTASESFRYNDFFNFYAQADTNFVANKDYKVEKFNYTNAIAYGLTYDLGKGIPAYIGKYRGQFDLEVNISGLGNDGHFDTIVQNGDKYGYDFSKYSCPYDLEVIIYDNEKDNCPPSNPDYPCLGGIAVIYRIIDMASGNKAKIFPGINAKDGGRTPGSNWAEFINNYQNKFKNITTTSYVYDRKPLYSIELSPTLIGEIRRNNNSYRDENMDPYTSYKDPKGNYKIKCTSGNDKSCTSSYITDLILRGKITGQFAESNDKDRRNLIMRYKAEGRL